MTTVCPRRGLAEIRASAEALLAAGQVDETCEYLLATLDAVLTSHRELELLVLKLRRARLGRHTEQLDRRQIALLFERLAETGGAPEPIDAEAEAREDARLDAEIAEAERAAASTQRARTRRKTGPGWQTAGVERHVHQIDGGPEVSAL
jgi:hypothetical protein